LHYADIKGVFLRKQKVYYSLSTKLSLMSYL
jgi:hypothetical protein